MVKISESALFGTEGTRLTAQELEDVLDRIEKQSRKLVDKIGSHSFVSTTVEKLDGKNMRTSVKGESENGLFQVKAEVESLLKLKALQTHLMEARRLAGERRQEVKSMDLEDYCKAKGIELGELQSLEDYRKANKVDVEPVEDEVEEVSEDEILCDLDIKTRARMLTLNATAAAVGTCIHPTGAFATAREELMTSMTASSDLKPVGTLAVITSTVPTVGISEVDKVFFELQTLHRELEAEDNRIRTTVQQKINEEKLRRIAEHKAKLEKYGEQLRGNSEILKKYTNEIKKPYMERKEQLEKEMEEWRNEELARIDHLMVVVPKEMKSTLAEIN